MSGNCEFLGASSEKVFPQQPTI